MTTLVHSFDFSNKLEVPERYTENPLDYAPHPLAVNAMKHLQEYLTHQTDFKYSFGWKDDKSVGKMFGVLVVKTNNNIGYIAAYSGKIFNHFELNYFVPPVYDMFHTDSFYVSGEKHTKSLNQEFINLKALQQLEYNADRESRINEIKIERQAISKSLQSQLFDQYRIINCASNYESIATIFNERKIIPKAGSGDCATIRLFQYAFEHNLAPLALGEFWWGADTPSKNRIHLAHYTACIEKCAPILDYMFN